MRLVILFSLLISYSRLLAQDFEAFKKEVEAFKSDKNLRHASWSLYVKEVGTQKDVFAFNQQLSLTPASTQKIITTACALELLGELYVYKTKIQYIGHITAEGVLNGNLIVKGAGDPTLESENFDENKISEITLEKIAKAIEKAGIKKVEGNIIVDVSVYDDFVTPVNWLWTDIGNYFGAGPSGLSYKDNKVIVYFKSGANTGDSTYIVRTEPEVSSLKIINEVKTGTAGSGDNAYFYGAEFQNLRIVKGTIPPNKDAFTVECAMPDAAQFFGEQLKKQCVKNGISISGEALTSRTMSHYNLQLPSKRTTIDSIVSPPLKRIVHYTNLKSINLYAEHLLKSLSLLNAPVGNSADGVKVIEQFMRSLNIDISGMKLTDGSGLSPVNKLTTRQQVDLLVGMVNKPCYKSFLESLPVAGKTGSLSSMLKGTTAEGNLKAKSGYIGGVRAYAGYFTNSKGELCAFSFIVNNFDGTAGEMRKKMEAVMAKMVY